MIVLKTLALILLKFQSIFQTTVNGLLNFETKNLKTFTQTFRIILLECHINSFCSVFKQQQQNVIQ